MPEIWINKIRTGIIPNNRRILNIIEINSHLLIKEENKYVQKFKQHLKDFESKHIFNSVSASVRFPTEITEIYV